MKRTVRKTFPLGDKTFEEVREIARRNAGGTDAHVAEWFFGGATHRTPRVLWKKKGNRAVVTVTAFR